MALSAQVRSGGPATGQSAANGGNGEDLSMQLQPFWDETADMDGHFC